MDFYHSVLFEGLFFQSFVIFGLCRMQTGKQIEQKVSLLIMLFGSISMSHKLQKAWHSESKEHKAGSKRVTTIREDQPRGRAKQRDSSGDRPAG